MHSADDLVVCPSNFNGYVGRHVDGFNRVHLGNFVGKRNLEG